MAPTRVLYGNIVSDIRKAKREQNARRNRAKNQEPVIEKNCDATEKPDREAVSQSNVHNPLENFTIQELWDEIKRRGCTIDDNKLVRKEIFD